MDEAKYRQQHQLLGELLAAANLQDYLDVLIHRLKVHSTGQLKYVKDDDLLEVGMTKPEVQRLMKLYRKQAAQSGTFSKLKKKLLKAGDEDGGNVGRSPSKSGVHRPRPTSVSDGGRAHLRGGLHAGLISAPQNDLRHTLHVGYDGVVFGDLSQIGHDSLPSHVDATEPSSDCDDVSVSTSSLSVGSRRRHTTLDTVSSDVDTASFVSSIISSSDTLTDVSSLHDIDDSDDVNDDDMSQCQQVVAGSDWSTTHLAADNLSDLTIPDSTNFDLGSSLVDEVMKAFGGAGKAERLEKSPARIRTVEENSYAVTVPYHSEEAKISDNTVVEHSSNNVNDSATEETFVSAEDTDRDIQTSATEYDEKCGLPSGAESLKSNQVLVLSESSVIVSDTKSSRDTEREAASFEIWRQQQQLPPNKSEQLMANIPWKNGSDAASLTEGSRYPAVIGNCSLSPRPVYPRESASRSLSATKRSPSSALSSSSEERIPAGRSSRVTTSLVAASSSSLPARSSLSGDSWSKLSHYPAAKVPSADSSDSESGNFLQRLKGKASLSRLSGLRLSIDSRTTKSGLPTQNLHVNVHFFDRLREQELQNSSPAEDAAENSMAEVQSDNQTLSSVTTSQHFLSRQRDSSRSCPVHEPRISEHCEADISGVESVSGGLDVTVTSPIISLQDQVACLRCRSTESHDSFSEHSSTTTQPSDEGVYSDDSVAASADELRPGSKRKTSTIGCSTAAPTAIALGISDRDDVFWTCCINFRDFVNIEERCGGVTESQATESAAGRPVTEDLQLMSAVVSDVSCEERLYALSEMSWDVNNAIKLLLLRRLMSSTAEDAERCKEALMSAGWDVRLASWNLGPRPREPDSPEIVHV